MSDTEGKIWYRISSGPHIEETLVIKETTHKITEQVDIGGRKVVRIHNKKNSYCQYVATAAEVRKAIEEMICDEKNWVRSAKQRILKTEEKIMKMEDQLLTGSFPVVKLKPSTDSKTEPLAL